MLKMLMIGLDIVAFFDQFDGNATIQGRKFSKMVEEAKRGASLGRKVARHR
jgi:hypothetical protein